MLKKLFIKLNILLVVITLLSYLSPWISPEIFWPIAFFGLAYPILLIINGIFILFWLFTDWKYSLYSILVILAGWSYLFTVVGHGDLVKDQKSDFTIGTFNTFGFSKLRRTTKYDPIKIGQVVKRNFSKLGGIDILCVQESNGLSSKALDIALQLPYSHQYSKQGAMVFSRFPILDKGSIRFSNETNSCVWVDLKTPKKNIRVYCLHLQSNRISKDADQLAKKPNLDERRTWKKIKSILRNYSKYSKYRANEANIVKAHSKSSPTPVIIAGDFNDHPLSYTYQQLSDGLDDSFIKRGSGIGSTYKGIIPFLRIDYILTDPAIHILTHDIIDQNLSDHKMILSKVKLDD